jgi:hypothetical protein
MKLERNVKEPERKAVVRHVQYRAHAVRKKNSHVRVRGHEINPEKLFRWMKEVVIDQPSIFAEPPSRESILVIALFIVLIIIALPSCISICTNSPSGSPKLMSSTLLEYQPARIGSMSPSNISSAVMQRLLKYAQVPKHIIESQEARAVFNDLQLILSCDRPAREEYHGDAWNPIVEEDIIRVRNLMNTTQGLTVDWEWNGR